MTVWCAGLDGSGAVPSKPAHQTVSYIHRVTYTRCRINTIDSPDDEHRGARNMQETGIYVYEKRIVRQVGYLQKFYAFVAKGE